MSELERKNKDKNADSIQFDIIELVNKTMLSEKISEENDLKKIKENIAKLEINMKKLKNKITNQIEVNLFCIIGNIIKERRKRKSISNN